MRSRETKDIILPMEARSVASLPEGANWVYEPKWDGFRCLAVKDGNDVLLQGKSGKPLDRYFPEVVKAIASIKQARFVIDGEIIIMINGELSFEALQMRLHPAASRIAKLSKETPASFTAFDALLDEKGENISGESFKERRKALGRMFGKLKSESITLTKQTTSLPTAQDWLASGFAGTDGVIAKRLDLAYRFGERAMLKVKRIRTADCVVGGFRYA